MSELSTSEAGRPPTLSKEKLELFKLLRKDAPGSACDIGIHLRPRNGRGSVAPASWGQERLYFIEQLECGRVGYQVSVAMRLWGELSSDTLKRSLDTVVQRHEVLRTVFKIVGGELKQCIQPDGRFDLKMIDLTSHDESQREAEVRLHKVEEVHQRFDLKAGPLMRGRLLRIFADEYLLLITMHHTVADGWSKRVLIQEVAELYGAYRNGLGDPLERLPIQYADYAHWQRHRWLTPQSLSGQLSYWRGRLHDIPPHLDLPVDRPRSQVQSYRGENLRFSLSRKLSESVRSFAHHHRMTLFMVLFAAWSILLSRLSGQEDIVVGTPVANRPTPETERLIGMFVNTLVLRVQVEPDLPLKEFLEQVKHVILEAYENKDVPFEKVIETLRFQRSLSRSPILQVMFIFHSQPKAELQLPALVGSAEDVADEPAIVDLWISMQDRDGEIVGSVNYAADIFDRETVMRWSACFEVLLGEMTKGSPPGVGDLEVLPAGELKLMTDLFNSERTVCSTESLDADGSLLSSKVHVLDQRMKVAPIGVVGEIYLRGEDMEREYLNQSEFNVGRFGRDPLGETPNAWIYRTGELGRWCADGTLQCRGRNDQRVLMRGVWIELNEIRSQIVKHAQITDAMVVLRDTESSGDCLLVAYVTVRGDSHPSPDDLHAYLKGVLPDYMIPAAFVVLGRRRLEEYTLRRPRITDLPRREYQSPRGEVEAKLATIWQEVLGVERVGRHDNFFDLGGHSLMSTRVVWRIRELLQLQMQVRELFERPTIKELAARLQAGS